MKDCEQCPTKVGLDQAIAAKVVSAAFSVITFLLFALVLGAFKHHFGFPIFKEFPKNGIDDGTMQIIYGVFVGAIIIHHLRIFFGVSLVHDWKQPQNRFDVYKKRHVFFFLITYPIFPYLAKFEAIPFFLGLWAVQLAMMAWFSFKAIVNGHHGKYLRLETIIADVSLVALWLTFVRYGCKEEWLPGWVLTVSDGNWLGLSLFACFCTAFGFSIEMRFYWGPGKDVVRDCLLGLRNQLDKGIGDSPRSRRLHVAA